MINFISASNSKFWLLGGELGGPLCRFRLKQNGAKYMFFGDISLVSKNQTMHFKYDRNIRLQYMFSANVHFIICYEVRLNRFNPCYPTFPFSRCLCLGHKRVCLGREDNHRNLDREIPFHASQVPLWHCE